jgi:superfamily II DNA or RNA helicase
MELRPYQKEAVQALRDNKKGIIAAATGSGKTTMMAASIKEKAVHGKILVLVHLQDLVVQTAERFQNETELTIAQYYGQTKDDFTDVDVVVATWQSLHSLTDNNSIPSDYFYSINVDEAHHIRGEKYQVVVNHFSPTYLHGFTATPYGPGQEIIFEIFGEVLFSINIFELMDLGYLTKLKIKIFNTNSNALKDELWDEYESKKNTYLKKMENQLISENRNPKIVHFFKDKKAIECYQKKSSILKGAPYVSGKSHKTKRKILRTFSQDNQEINHLYTVRMLNEGIDIPIINGLAFHENSGDLRTFTQRLGRGLRVYNSPDAITYIYQFLDLKKTEDITAIHSLLNEVKHLNKTGNSNKKYHDYVSIELDKETEEFLKEYQENLDNEIHKRQTLRMNCPKCNKIFQISEINHTSLLEGDEMLCPECGNGWSVQTRCNKCQSEAIIPVKKYRDYIDRGLEFKCNQHSQKNHPPLKIKCKNCAKDISISYARYHKSQLKGQKNFFCSRECHSEYSRVSVYCNTCGKEILIRKGDLRAKISRSNKIYCSEHKMVNGYV